MYFKKKNVNKIGLYLDNHAIFITISKIFQNIKQNRFKSCICIYNLHRSDILI